MKILFLIRSLDTGGAERQTVVLSKGLHQLGHEVAVARLYSVGSLDRELREADIPVIELAKTGRWDVLPFFVRLARAARAFSPDAIYAVLGGPNILTACLRPLLPTARVIWTIRASFLDLGKHDRFAQIGYQLERRLARFADAIIANSCAGLEYAVAQGFPRQQITVVPNGIDTDRFVIDDAVRVRLRQEFLVRDTDLLVGLVGRLDPIKDHPTFLHAAAEIARETPEARFVCVGGGDDRYRKELRTLADKLGLEDRLLWVDARGDMPAVYNALDLLVSSSYGEGFANVIGEAMACGVPCVVTDVGDSARVVGDLGAVVKPRSARELSDGIRSMLRKPASELRQAIRASIVERYSVRALVANTERILAGEAPTPGSTSR